MAISGSSIRFASTLPSGPLKLIDSLPPTSGDLSFPVPPPVPDNLFESLAQTAFEGGLPRLEALTSIGQMKEIYGLCSNWTPAGWIQSAMEVLHVGAGLPWYALIYVLVKHAI